MLNTDNYDKQCVKRICKECEYYRADGNCIAEWAYQQGKMESILHQCNHDLAVKEAYQQGKTDVLTELLSIKNHCDNCYMNLCESCRYNGEYAANIQAKLEQLKEQTK